MDGITPTIPLGNDGFGNSGIWLFAILALMFGGFGRGGYGFDGHSSIENTINESANFTRLESQVRDNANLVERKADALANGLSTLGYEIAQKFESVNANIQSVKDLIQTNKIEELQQKINKLELEASMQGVVRYPNGYTYCAGQSPFCGCNNTQTI